MLGQMQQATGAKTFDFKIAVPTWPPCQCNQVTLNKSNKVKIPPSMTEKGSILSFGIMEITFRVLSWPYEEPVYYEDYKSTESTELMWQFKMLQGVRNKSKGDNTITKL